MICVTTNSIEGQEIISYRGIVTGTVIFGANVVKDIIARADDVIGGRSEVYEQVFNDAQAEAMKLVQEKAERLGANAIIGMSFDHEILGASNAMPMVAAKGTAVIIRKNAARRRADEAAARDDEPEHFVHLNGNRRGPLSKNQLRELLRSGSVTNTTQIENEAGDELASVEHILAAS